MRFTHSRAIKNVETPGSEGSIQRGRQTPPFPSGEPKKMTCASMQVLADGLAMLRQFSKDETQENRK